MQQVYSDYIQINNDIMIIFTYIQYYLCIVGNPVQTQAIPLSQTLLSQLKNRESNATHEIVFKTDRVPSLGFISYYVQKVASSDAFVSEFKKIEPSTKADVLAIENEVKNI